MISASEFLSEDKGNFNVIVNSFLPSTAVIPTWLDSDVNMDYLSEECSIKVKVGDIVAEGQVIANTPNLSIHSSVPGVVTEISTSQIGNGKQGPVVKVNLKGEFSFVGKKLKMNSWESFDSDELSLILKNSGVVNTFYDCIPIYSQIKKYEQTKILAVRLFDDDPSRVIESFVAEKLSKKVIEGAAILAKTLKVKAVVFVYEKNNSNIKKIYEDLDNETSDSYTEISDMFNNIDFVTIPIDVKKYPSGTFYDIINVVKNNSKSILKRKNNLSEVIYDFGTKDFFVDSQTLVSIYDAVVLKMPVINRYVHVTGECLNAAAIMNVKIGTSLKQLVEQCGGFKRRLAKIVINGIINGYSVSSLNIPVTQMIKSVEFVPESQSRTQYTELCVRCGNCRKICPVHLWPGNINRAYRLSRLENDDINENDKFILDGSKICIECGLCNAVCPSRIPLRQTIMLIKNSIDFEDNLGNENEK